MAKSSGSNSETSLDVTKSTTYDSVWRFHELSDERLRMVVNMNKDSNWDVFLTALGISLGFLQNLWSVGSNITDGQPVHGGEALGALICAIAIAVACVCFFNWWTGKDDLKNALEEIQNRPTRTETINVNAQGSPQQTQA